MADVYVVLDNVQYRRRYFQNRNKIRTKNGWQWLTVPLEKETRDDLFIRDAVISTGDPKWKEANIKSIYHNYCKAENFGFLWDELKEIYGRDISKLSDFNMSLIQLFFDKMGMDKKVVHASRLEVSGEKGDLILSICKALDAQIYVSGISGKDYLDFRKFEENNIKVIFQEFHHPIYKQCYTPFVPCISVIDLLFNYGDKSLDIINGKGVPVIEELFL